MLYRFAPTKVRQVSFATKLQIRISIIVMAVVMEEMLIADMQHWRDALQMIIHSHSGVKRIHRTRRFLLLTRVVNGQTEHARMDLVLTSTVQSRIWMSLSLLLSLAVRPWFLLPAQNQDIWPRERRRANLTGTRTSISFRSFLRSTGGPGPHARKFINYFLRDADNPPTAVRDTWSTIQSVLHSAISKQQLTAAVA